VFWRLRVSEGLSLYVEDLDLSLDNEHLTVVGKYGKRRTILLDDPRLVQQLRAYLKRVGYKDGPLIPFLKEQAPIFGSSGDGPLIGNGRWQFVEKASGKPFKMCLGQAG